MLKVPKQIQDTGGVLISQEASARAKQKEDLHTQQGKDMRSSFLEKENLLRNPVNMAQALAQVRTSSVSIPQSLSRFHGTTIYNPIPPKPERD